MCVTLLTALAAPATAHALPTGFFGIGPQAPITDADTQYMSAGGIEAIRTMASWSSIQPTPEPVYDWTSLDQSIALAARARIRVLPFLLSTPAWVAASHTTLPVHSSAQKRAWSAFVRAVVTRYGPGGAFWREHGPSSAEPVTEQPIRTWQIWNEANFHYFAYPVSPQHYARLLKQTTPAIKSIDPGARVVLAGLFGEPGVARPRGMSATNFLASLYRFPGIANYFDGVALHPYAFNQGLLRKSVEGVHRVIASNHDRASLYITEIGWGSEQNSQEVAFERGVVGQVRELRKAYRYLIGNQERLRVRGVYWFSWKDLPGSCSFCDSVGLFERGDVLVPKPAWRAFVGLTGGRASP